ncbi:gamma-glutamyltransferase [Aestuariibacter halophilus]|uniref:Gamma-glutamyltransferase n=1 Tax=Fluctibacter halophilus TaxID=226011 RepID=A0ABS8G558_9ALTE|nr:gamma-glutamyltransferase [Aestuariibacter halophilus]MCC2615722.1 gamma-glutamyltransferase [Aestuariibacter halophilus]
MPNSQTNIAFTAPHFAAAQTGENVLRQGGTAIEAMVAAAASIAVEYPHMNGLGGDGFWLISEPGKTPVAIDAAGTAGRAATLSRFSNKTALPSRGPDAAVTMAGAVSGWQTALQLSHQWQPGIPLAELLAPAIGQAKWGIEITHSLSSASHKTFDELSEFQGFAPFLHKGKPLKEGHILKLPALAATLEQLTHEGLDSFYRGEIAASLAQDLQQAGSLLSAEDFAAYSAAWVTPLKADISVGRLYNLPAPTQGIASLIILALYDRLAHLVDDEASRVHLIIECTKQAFLLRDAHVVDPEQVSLPLSSLLDAEKLDQLAAKINVQKALPWPHQAAHGDTIWMGACDQQGRMVSYIQSLYWEFGSGIVSPTTGIVWNNRGTSFSLDPDDKRCLRPGAKPFHTLNPAYAELHDGRRISYGTMGGEGQPQTQAALFSRYVYQNLPLAQSIADGRWLLGRTWGDQSHNLKLEADLADEIGATLASMGHDTAIVSPCNEMMGHAGAVVHHPDGHTEAATDPRSDGKAFPSGGMW